MSKKTNRRIDHKRIRQAERTALEGGHPRLIRSWSGWGPKLEQPMVDTAMPHRKARQKQRKPKDRCPVNRVHQFLKDVEYSRETFWWYEKRTFHVERTFKMCVHCGKEVTLKETRTRL